MLPHADVHCRRGEYGLVGCQQQRRCEIVSNACRHFGHQVRRRRCYDNQIGFTAKLDMAHFGFVLQIPQVGVDRLLTECRQRHRRDEMRTACGQDATHSCVRFAEKADQLTRLVRGNAAADDEEDPFAVHAVNLKPRTPQRLRPLQRLP